MNKLPLEIKEQIVGRTIWAPEPFDPKDEKWEDGPLKLELAEFHPLPHYLGHGDGNNGTPTRAEKSLVALMRTSKEFNRICQRFTRELVSGYGTHESHCACGSGAPCNFAETWGFSIERGTPGPHTKVLHVVDGDSVDLEILGYRGWPVLDPSAFDFLRPCAAVASLSLQEHTLGWLRPILAALPGQGARLRELAFAYPEEDSRPSEANLEVVLAAISGCSGLQTLALDHHWTYDFPNRSWAAAFFIRSMTALGNTPLQVRMSNLAGSDGSAMLGGRTALELLQQPLALGITRLAILEALVDSSTIQALVEASCGTLNYLCLDHTYFTTLRPTPDPLPRAVLFPHLRYVVITPQEYEDEPTLGPRVLPEHWEVPAIRHLEASAVGLSENGSVKEFTDQLHSWKTLCYLRIDGYWSVEVFYEDLCQEEDWDPKDEDADGRLEWVSTLESTLQQTGIDAQLHLESC